jgi:diacylglycerol kinase family enzyme
MLFERGGRYDAAVEIVGVGRAAFVFVSNADPYTYAGRVPLHVTPKATFGGGLDFLAPERVRPLDVPRLLAYFVRGRGRPQRVLRGHDLDRIEVRCDVPMPLQGDGEDLGDVEVALFEAEREALAVLV